MRLHSKFQMKNSRFSQRVSDDSTKIQLLSIQMKTEDMYMIIFQDKSLQVEEK